MNKLRELEVDEVLARERLGSGNFGDVRESPAKSFVVEGSFKPNKESQSGKRV